MAAYTTLVNLPHFLSSFTSLETGTLVLFLAAVFTVQLVLLQNYSRRLTACSLAGIRKAGAGDGWSSPLLLVYSVFLLLLYFAWVALFAALLALLIYPILKKLRI